MNNSEILYLKSEAEGWRKCAETQEKKAYETQKRLGIALAQLAKIKKAANWVLHVENGIGKHGDTPEYGEYIASLNALKKAISNDVCEECLGRNAIPGIKGSIPCPSCNGTESINNE